MARQASAMSSALVAGEESAFGKRITIAFLQTLSVFIILVVAFAVSYLFLSGSSPLYMFALLTLGIEAILKFLVFILFTARTEDRQ